MLRQRVITAVIMAALFLSAVAFLSLAWLALLIGVLVCLGGWEWSRLCGWESAPSRGLYVLVLALLMAGGPAAPASAGSARSARRD